MFVSPSNPTGAVYPRDEVEAIGRWAAERGIWVVTDEIYEHLTFGDHEFSSIATQVPELGDRVVVLNGLAKTYAVTACRRALLIRPAAPPPPHRVQRPPGRGAGRGGRRPGGGGRGGAPPPPPRPAHALAARRHPRRPRAGAPGGVLRLPQPVGLPGPDHPGPDAAVDG